MKTRLTWIVIAVASAAVGCYVFDVVPGRFYAYPPSGPEPVPGFSPLARAGFGCGVAAACLALLAGVAHLTRSTGRGQRVLVLAAVAGWSLFGLLAALAWSLVDASQTFLARPNSPGLYWAYARAAMLGMVWVCAVVTIPLALRRQWQVIPPNPPLQM